MKVNPAIKSSKKRKEGIKKVKFLLKPYESTEKAELVETDEDCNNLQVDLEECVSEAIDLERVSQEEHFKSISFNTVRIDDLYFGEFLKTGQCEQQAKSLGKCLKDKQEAGGLFLISNCE